LAEEIMRGRWDWWMIVVLAATTTTMTGCRMTPQLKDRSEPIPLLVPPTDGAPEPASKELPSDEAGRVCLGTAEQLEKSGDEVNAILLYEKARALDSKCKVGHRLAVLYDRQGNFQKAQDEYLKALKQSPHDADLLNDLGYGYYSRGRWAEAEKYLRQAVALKPKHAHATMNLAMCVGEQGRYDEALELFGKVVTPAQARCNLAFIMTTQRKWPEAKRTYQEALQIDPDIPIARAALAKLEKAEHQGPAPVQTAQAPAKPEGNTTMGYVQFDDAADNKSTLLQASYSAPAHP
jgi:Tfp pilus assembly protein PilF